MMCTMDKRVALLFLQLMMLVVCVLGRGHHKHHQKHRTAEWRSLLYHHQQWGGYYYYSSDATASDDSADRFKCSLYVHSVGVGPHGKALVSFRCGGYHIEMEGYSPDDHIVQFRQSHAWNKTHTHFGSHTNLSFNGSFVPDFSYFKYEAAVSSNESPNSGHLTLIPHGRPVNQQKSGKHGGKHHLGLVVGIPILVAVVVFSLAICLMVGAVRKGYLRHVPWTYKVFNNKDSSNGNLDWAANNDDEKKKPEPVAFHM